MQAFSLSAQFARESVMLKLPEERRNWGESKRAVVVQKLPYSSEIIHEMIIMV